MNIATMKILLADCYHDSDKGGGGMLAGAIDAIRAACGVHGVRPEISLLFRFSDDDPKLQSAARLTSKKYPDLPVLGAPVSSRRGPGVHWLSFVVKVIVLGGWRLVAPALSRHGAVRAMRDADFVLFKGGNFYRSWSREPISDLAAMFLLFYTPVLAWRLGKRFAFVSHTFGPFETSTAQWFVKWIISKAAYTSTREHPSKEILTRCGVSPTVVEVAPDFGFRAHAAEGPTVERILAKYGLEEGKFVAFTARPWFSRERKRGDDVAFQKYLSGVAALLDYAVDLGAARVALVVQNDGAHSRNEPDLPVLRLIHARMKHQDNAIVLDEDFAFDELCAIYHASKVVLGTRLHSCIFAFVSGTPAVAIAYSHKAPGIMKMMGMEDFVLDINDLSVEAGKQMLGTVFREREALAAKIPARRLELQAALDHCVECAIFATQGNAV